MCADSARGRPQSFTEYSPASTPSGALGTYPADCATTHNNNRGAVRYSNPSSNAVVISVWDLTVPVTSNALLATIGGGSLKAGEQTDLNATLYGYWPSDRIDLTATRGVSIGSGFSNSALTIQDETYIDLFSVNGTPALINSWQYSAGSAGNADDAGYANDVAFTRDGAWAVINGANWIHVLEMTPPLMTAPVMHDFNIGGYDFTNGTTWNRPCTPNQAVDSIALLNDVAIVTTGRESTTWTGRRTTWAYIIDLSVSPPTIVLQDEIPVPSSWDPQGDDEDPPHDVELIAYEESERYGIVTTRHGVAAYDLVNPARIGTHFAKTDQRRYQRQVDSVEEVDTRRFVVIADDTTNSPPTWNVKVFSVSTSALLLSKTYTGSTGGLPNRAHDLAIDQDSDMAIVRTSFDNVIVTSLTTPPASATVRTSPNGSDAHGYATFRSQTSYAVFSSDSVVIRPAKESDPRVMAATIGAYVDANGNWTGAVDIIDLSAAMLSVSQTNVPYDSGNDEGCVPVDLAMSADFSEVVVRSIDTLLTSGSTVEADVVRISLTSPFPINTRYGGTGTCNGVDSLAAPVLGYVASPSNKRVLSISQDTVSNGLDYAHISN